VRIGAINREDFKMPRTQKEDGSWEAMRLGRFKDRRGEDVKIRSWGLKAEGLGIEAGRPGCCEAGKL
jgi:hypothetical protein